MMCFRQLTVVVIVLLLFSCGGSGSSSVPASEEQASVTLGYVVNFPDNSAIAASSQIILIFDKTLDPSKVFITGSLATESDGGVWSVNSSENDTLTITPASSWTAGGNKILVIEIKDAAGSVLQTISLTYTIDLTAPQVTDVAPASASTIGGSQQIVITFDESMDISSLSLSGSMHTKSDAGVWSSTGENINDKLTLTPTPSWDAGAGQTLIVNVNDAVGNPLTSLNLGYTVDLSSPSVSSINAPNGTILLAAQPVIIVFDRTMDAASLALGNNMAAEAGTAAWSDTNNVNDTLTIPPAATWTAGYWANNDGIAQQLSINARDSLGNSLPTLTLGYIVDVISVSNTGDDTNPGTLSLPMKNIGSALAKAESLGIKNVYVQAGNYSGTAALVDGINIKGGFNNLWIYDNYTVSGHAVVQDGASGGAFFANNIATETRIENMVLTGSDASGVTLNATNSSYVVRVANSSKLILSDVKIISGNGADGADGNGGQYVAGFASSGSSGEPAQELSTLCDDTTTAPGGSGGFGGTRSGGNGGKGGTVDTSCINPGSGFYIGSDFDASDGQPGENASGYSSGNDGKGGDPGQGDISNTCDISLIGSVGSAGADGSNGADGTASVSPSGDIVNAFWLVSGDGDDGGAGTDGMGGGGGGGSGGCDDGKDKYGAGGGGGGAGGAASAIPGSGGMAGGYSFGIFAVNSSITTNNVEIILGTGGAGGTGGSGGAGQSGGAGGSGGAWVDNTINDGIAGGRGGNGGKGGNSGAGGGGAGGSVYGIYSGSSTITTNNTTFTGGTPGIGGTAPNQGVSGSVMDIGP